MFVLDEQSRMVEQMVRQWCGARLTPQVPAMEAGTTPPFPLMKELAKTFGLAALADGAVDRRLAKLEKLARDAKLLELGAGTTDINLLAAARELIGPEFT